jgi:hypothetical protein
MEKKWKEFVLGPARKGDLHVTICRKGNILIGSAAFDRLGRPDAAVLLFDEDKNLIGVRPTHPKTPNAFPMNPMKWGRHRILRANRFCRHHGIKVDRLTAFNEPTIEDSVLVLDMNRVRPVGK